MSKRSSSSSTSDQKRVREHYNDIDTHGHSQQERRALPTIEVRSLHNWLKEQQCQLHVRRGDVVFDLCCGKGGDLEKMNRAGVRSMVLVDLSEISVQEARRRAAQLKGPLRDHCTFLVGDVFTKDFWAKRTAERAFISSLRQNDIRFVGTPLFPVISCQFALHYAFQSRESAELLFSRVARHLGGGGVFFGIVANGDAIVAKFDAVAPKNIVDEELFSIRRGGQSPPKTPSVVQEEVPQSSSSDTGGFRGQRPLGGSRGMESPFGDRYYFTMKDGSVVDVPEYVTRERVVRECASAAGLDCIYFTPLRDFYASLCRERPAECAGSLERRKLANISASTWSVAQLYSAFAFRRQHKTTARS